MDDTSSIKSEEAQYLLNYFPRLLTKKETIANSHFKATNKIGNESQYNNPKHFELRKQWYIDRNLYSTDPNILKLLENGYEDFQLKISSRILKEKHNEIFINKCPLCYQITRTPYARQCKRCYNSWHDQVKATFNPIQLFYNSVLRKLHLKGKIIGGKVQIGNLIDFTFSQINLRSPIIKAKFRQENIVDLTIKASKSEKQLIEKFALNTRKNLQILSNEM